MTHQYQSAARNLIHEAVGCKAGSDECDRITKLLNEVGDDRAHAEAAKLREHAELLVSDGTDIIANNVAAVHLAIVESIDPYELRDGQLVRKSDGTPITH